MRYPLVLELADDGIPVAVTCPGARLLKQTFYKWRVNPVSDRDWADAHLVNAAYDIHADDPTFGYRFIADELPAQGILAGENRVARLCSQQRIWSLHARKRGRAANRARRCTTTSSTVSSPRPARTRSG